MAIVGEKAYWVQNNTFYEGDVINGFVDNTAGKAIDAHSLSSKEFYKLMEILDNIS